MLIELILNIRMRINAYRAHIKYSNENKLNEKLSKWV